MSTDKTPGADSRADEAAATPPAQAAAETAPSPAANASKLQLARRVSLLSYAATLLLSFNWISWYSPPQEVPRALILLLLVVPLVLPVRGFLHGRAKSYIGVAMVAMWLFAAGLDIAFYIQPWKVFGWGLVACSVALFVSSYFYLRYLPRPPKAAPVAHD